MISLKNFNRTILYIFLLAINLYGSALYRYDYDYDNMYRRLHPRIISYEVLDQEMPYMTTDLFEDLLDPNISTKEADRRVPKLEEGINPRTIGGCADSKCAKCLDSCRNLKKSKIAYNSIIQYTYLRLCSMGCKEEIDCLDNNYCLPVMPENPDYFVQCSNKCNLFLIVPKIFKTGSVNKCQ